MKRPLTSHAILFVFLSLLFALSCFHSDSPTTPDEAENNDRAVTAIAEAIHAKFAPPDTAIVLFTGPVEPGTILAENVHEDSGRAELAVPDSAGEYYAILIDYQPGRLFQHAVRYGWMEVARGDSGSTTGDYWITVLRPGVSPAPFQALQLDEVGGVEYYAVDGEGGPDLQSFSHKAIAEDPLTDDAGVFVQSRDIARAPISLGIVFDGGARKGILQGGPRTLDNKFISEAKNLSEKSADPVAAWLKSRKFVVMRVSQYWGNDKPYLKSASDLVELIKKYAEYYKLQGKPDGGCDNFYFYMTAHGYKDGKGAFEIHPPSGNGNFDVLSLSTFLDAFESFPDFVKVTIHVDNCYAGKVITEHRPKIATLCKSLCALTIMASVDSVHEAWVPDLAHDSGTEDFMDGATVDHDGDGVKGDVRDRFEEMKSQGGSLNPMSFHCPDGGSWCVLDGPVATQQACAAIAETYVASVGTVTDPGGHAASVGDPFEGTITISSGETFTVTGMPPFVDVTGAIDEDCNFAASGFGEAAGAGDVLVEMRGWYENGSVDFTYVMGLRGELGGDEAITFDGSATVYEAPNLLCPELITTWDCTVGSVFDPAGHRQFVGEPFENPITITAKGENGFTAVGMPPFVNVSGTILPNGCEFFGTARGNVAGVPNVLVEFGGSVEKGTLLDYRYIMGAEGELGGGAAITFFGRGTERE